MRNNTDIKDIKYLATQKTLTLVILVTSHDRTPEM